MCKAYFTGRAAGAGHGFRAGLLAAALLLLLTACAGTRSGPEPEFLLDILHTNDVHAAWGGRNAEGGLCYAARCADGLGGSVRLLQLAQAVRRDRENLLFLDAGDEFQGSLFFNQNKDALAAEIMNRLGYDACTPGNHEFDDGPETFARFSNRLDMPVLAANLAFGPAPEFRQHPRVSPWTIVEKNGRRIGLVGLLTPDTARDSSPGPAVLFSDPAAALAGAVAELESRGVNIIIALTHIGLDNDLELARTVGGVDVIVGGHSHSFLSNFADQAVGPYPIRAISPRGEPVLIVQTGYGGTHAGLLRAVFDREGKILRGAGDNLPLDDALLARFAAPPPEAGLAALLEDQARPIRALLRAKIGRLHTPGREGLPLDRPDVRICREEECLSANLVVEAMLALPGVEADAALLNAGALRNSLPGGEVAAGDVLAALPFANYLEYADLPGAVLLAALEHGAAAHGRGGFLHTAGLAYAIDLSSPPGRRVSGARLKDRRGNYRPLDPAGTYRVITVDFVAHGGDGYAMLAALPWRNTARLLSDSLVDYLKENASLAPRRDGRVSLRGR